MVIEWLKFKVKPELREKFIKEDAEIWTAFLTRRDGHLGKEVWINPEKDDEVVAISRWQTLEQWKSIPENLLKETEEKFSESMGKDSYELIEAGQYQIRKFIDNSKT
ncbi:MAG: hypothetical protein N5P05_002454 [Chroococcopsis gigantea SAG 12.99]|jgi:uncharacterized protein (TIGR03792 family)|nr:hypothetical protein [Chroococcopsis gigantea SAG 12.99]